MASPSTGSHDAETIGEHKLRAAELAARGELDASLAEYRNVLALAPDDVSARQRAAEILARLGRVREAVDEYQHLVGRFASDGQLLKAIAICHMIFELDPKHVVVQSTVADLFARHDPQRPPSVRLSPAMSEAITGPPAVRSAGHVVDLDRIARIPLFSELDRNEFLSIVKDLRRRDVRRGETIVVEGDDGASMYVIVEGAVRVTRRPPGVEPRVIGDMTDGEFFGEIALLARSPRLASVVALADTELLELRREQLDAIVQVRPRVGEVVRRFCKERLLGNMLRAAPLFKLLQADHLDRVIDLFQLETCNAGTLLLEEGAPGKGLLVILRGECDVFHTRGNGSIVPYPTMHEGDVFGELSLLQDGRVTASVRASSACVLLLLKREWFDELLLESPAVRERIYALAAERAQRTHEVIASEHAERYLV